MPLFIHSTGEQTDLAKKRIAMYVLMTVSLILLAFYFSTIEWVGSKEIHTIMELVSTILAFTVGVAALTSFYSKKDNTILFIGAGFLGTAFLDGYHTVVTSVFFDQYFPSPPPSLIPWSWIASRLFLSVMMYVSWWAWNRESKLGEERNIQEKYVYIFATISTIASFLFFAFVPLPRAYYGELFFPRPEEFIPALFFVLALIGYLKKGRWKENPFEHCIVISLIIGSLGQLIFMSFSNVLFDTMFDAAHILKIASYIGVEVGLLINMYYLFNKAEQNATELRLSNEELDIEIKERKLAEKALLDSKEQANAVVDNIVDGIITIDEKGLLESFNPAAEKIFGYTAEEVIGKNLKILMPEPYHSEHDSYLQSYRETGEAKIIGYGREVIGKRKDGSTFPLDLAVNEIRAGKKTIYTGIIRDITERKLAEDNLAQSEVRYRTIVEEASNIVYTADSDQKITYINPPGLKLSGFTKEEILGSPITFCVHPDWVEVVKTFYLNQQDEMIKETLFEFPILTKTKEEKWVEQTVALLSEGNKVKGFQAIVRDITERKAADRKLKKAKAESERANQAKSHFLASMSHELRTPLNSVIGFANILLKNKNNHLKEKELVFLSRISENGKRLLEIINDILDLSKIEAGRMNLELSTLSVGNLIKDTISQLEAQLENKQVRLIADIPDNLHPVETDSGKLRQVLVNLIGNSIKFTEKGYIKVRVITNSSSNIAESIEVEDTGVGIAENKLSEIFSAFKQAEEGTSRKYEGTGLGLTISKSLCELLGYDLEVKSSKGRGAVFTISGLNQKEIPDETTGSQDDLSEEISQIGE